jgi:hypothetical protein
MAICIVDIAPLVFLFYELGDNVVIYIGFDFIVYFVD